MNNLDYIFKPKSVAVIGASEKIGVGRTLMENLQKCKFGGEIYPINPKSATILGVPAYKSISLIGKDKVELAIIAIKAGFVPGAVKECAENGVKAVIIISAGFAEMGEPGRKLEREIMSYAAPVGMRVVGPNCLGVEYSPSGLNASFAAGMIKPGKVAFLSQSGALCSAVLDYSFKADFGFSAFVSVGSMLDVDWPALIEYFGNDDSTAGICIYMETVGKAKPFLEACQKVTPKKPVVVIKAGRSAAGAKAATSHTGALAGADAIADAAFERAGVLRVIEITDLFALMEIINNQPLPKGNKLTIVTNAGGPGVLSTDALAAGGGALTEITPETLAEFNKFLPDAWSHGNPVDVLGDALPDRYAKTLDVCIEDKTVDGILVILTPQDMSDPTGTAKVLTEPALVQKYHNSGKLVMCSWMGGVVVDEGANLLRAAKIPTFAFPDEAVRVFNHLARYHSSIALLNEPTPAVPSLGFDIEAARKTVRDIYTNAFQKGRTILSEYEAKQVLAAYHIPCGQTLLGQTPDEAVECAKKIGFPVVMKVHSETITHKSDVGGVKLNIKDEAGVRAAYDEIKANVTKNASAADFLGCVVLPMIKMKDSYEIILGANIDPQFGPVILFGLGGVLVEVMKDTAMGLAPLNKTYTNFMIQKTKIAKALKGVRGRDPVKMDELVDTIIRMSYLVADHPMIKEFDINPLLASPDGIMALDARIIIYDQEKGKDEAALPKTCVPVN